MSSLMKLFFKWTNASIKITKAHLLWIYILNEMHHNVQIHWNEKVIQFHFTTISQTNNKIWSFRKLILYTKFIVPMDQMDVYKYFIYLYHFDIYGWALYTKPEKNDSEFMGQQSHGSSLVFFFSDTIYVYCLRNY